MFVRVLSSTLLASDATSGDVTFAFPACDNALQAIDLAGVLDVESRRISDAVEATFFDVRSFCATGCSHGDPTLMSVIGKLTHPNERQAPSSTPECNSV